MAESDATSETAVAEILLQEYDLPPKDEGYLTLMNENDYAARYGDPPKLINNGRRLLIVLPLHVVVNGNHQVIPIPFIVDTGSPEAFYLGSGARNILREKQVLFDVVNPNRDLDRYYLRGIFYNQEKSLHHPFAEELPEHYERPLTGDIRINILGLKGMKALNVRIDWNLV